MPSQKILIKITVVGFRQRFSLFTNSVFDLVFIVTIQSMKILANEHTVNRKLYFFEHKMISLSFHQYSKNINSLKQVFIHKFSLRSMRRLKNAVHNFRPKK